MNLKGVHGDLLGIEWDFICIYIYMIIYGAWKS